MLVVGERLNSTRKSVAPAIKNRDTEFVKKEASAQAEAGAAYIDCNAATVGKDAEPEALCWLVETVQSVVDLPCALDSPNAAAIEAALQVHRGTALINSITAESSKYDDLARLAAESGSKVIALAMGDDGIPSTAEDRLKVARELVANLNRAGVAIEDIFVDPLVFPVSSDPENGRRVMQVIEQIREEYPGVHTIAGISNVSHGLPKRFLLNQAFTVLCMGAGLDAAIIDPLDERLMSLIIATRALLGQDEFCMDYISAARADKLIV